MRLRGSSGGANRASQRTCSGSGWLLLFLIPVAVILILLVYSSSEGSSDGVEGDLTDQLLSKQLPSGNLITHDFEKLVKNAVHFPEHVLLLSNSTKHLSTGRKILCLYNGKVVAAALGSDSGMVRCLHPPEKDRDTLAGKPVTVVVDGKAWATEAKYLAEESWESLVYAGVDMQEDDEILIFAKGIVTEKKERKPALEDLRCVFGRGSGKVETDVMDACMEGIRCQLPPLSERDALIGQPIAVQWKGKLLPTVLEYNTNTIGGLLKRGKRKGPERYEICVCTAIFNGAKFLKEWVMYHAFMGVQRWLLYDNNSEDNLRQVIRDLSKYNITRHYWPWLKTQEAAFSHCAIRAERAGCKWIGYFDVDEFFFTKSFLPTSSNAPEGMTQLQALIEKSHEKVAPEKVKLGQVKVRCVSFGPSGLKALKPGGQMVSYTCRETKVDRHKSIVLIEAMDKTRCGLVHHFDLKEGYGSAEWRKAHATVNHYKYPVWDDFALKFVRRVSAYVADWDKEDHLDSKDRVAGLGTVPKEPSDWPSRFCAEQDTGLRDFVIDQFQDRKTKKLPWE